ncbi:GntR family transcriptional regulator [Larkinella soli]|uniref:GntR family transcriptional regulator n=1 Tax=Larkinella soli TaxID=1770527 RepID=UPI000FFC4BA4|nr:GntR family transcriptional regulator [Larkinella soli]
MDFKDNQAIYLQIADYVCDRILLGQWTPGDRIPSVRDLGGELEVNPNTTMRAYEVLQQKGIIFNKRGIGYFAAEEAKDRILSYRREQFLENELPAFFRNLYLLNIPIEEIERKYRSFVEAEFSPGQTK